MNPYLIFVLVVIIGAFLFDLVVDWLNMRHVSTELPEEFQDVYDAEKYRESQEYLRVNTRFGMLQAMCSTPLIVAFILFDGFYYVDQLARQAASGEILRGLVFAAILMIASFLLNLPFSLYHTFVIEERFGFNKTTIGTFIMDLVKGTLIGVVIGGLFLAGVIWFFAAAGPWAWLIAWAAATAFQLLLFYLVPVFILPLFNKFEPLAEGELRESIERYARQQDFKLGGIFTMDGSKRSTKANAYFTGFGRNRRIVLFDTLVEKQTVDELTAVLAHEMGHFKLKHIPKQLMLQILSTGALFFLLSLFIKNEQLFAAFGIPPEQVSIYASLFFVGFLFSPISMVFGLVRNVLSRKYEFEADDYAARTYGKPESLINALKKLSVDNLSNLTPHPLKVAVEYTHPPVLQRIRAMRGGKN